MFKTIRRFRPLKTVAALAFLFVGFGPANAQSFAYVADYFSDSLSVIETGGNTVVATIPVGNNPAEIAFTPDGAFAYVTNNGPADNSVSVVSTASNSVVATIPVVRRPRGIAATPDGAFVYVVNADTGFFPVSAIDAASSTVVSTIPVGAYPFGVATLTINSSSADKARCKNGGWRQFTNPPFKNQGQCVSFVESRSRQH